MKLQTIDSAEAAEQVRCRIQQLHSASPDSIGDILNFELLECDTARAEFVFRCKTAPWMRNVYGTLHGGICSTVLDQAMGYVAYCVKPGEGIAPTIELQTYFHRALVPGRAIIVKVTITSITRTLIHLRAEAYAEEDPEALAISGSAIYFFKAV